jgi:hypothetical protein
MGVSENLKTKEGEGKYMRRVAKLIGAASVLCCLTLVLTVFSSSGQPGKPVSDAQAATLTGGCHNPTWGDCDHPTCSGQVVTATESGSSCANGNIIYCCSDHVVSCSNCGSTECR